MGVLKGDTRSVTHMSSSTANRNSQLTTAELKLPNCCSYPSSKFL